MTTTNILETMNERSKFTINRIRTNTAYLKTAPVKRILDTIGHLVDKYQMECYSEVGAYSSCIYLTMKGLTGLKDQNLADMLEALVYSNPTASRTNDYPDSYSRMFSFTWDGPTDYETGYKPTLSVSVTANFKEDSDTCRRVVVGYREPSKEPTPIYELQCRGRGCRCATRLTMSIPLSIARSRP